MKKYPINVDIRISGYFIAKQTASKMVGQGLPHGLRERQAMSL